MSAQTQRSLLLGRIVAEVEQRVNAFFAYGDSHPGATLGELEVELRRLSRDCFALALEGHVEARRVRVEIDNRCPACGGRAANKGPQTRSQETAVGRIQIRRTYQYCATCGTGRYPLDEALQIGSGQFSETLQEGICHLATLAPFAAAAESFTRVTGVSVSPREVERLTEERGTVVEERLAAEGAWLARTPLPPHPPACPARAGAWVVELDAARVRFGDGWHDVKAGVVFWSEPPRDDTQGEGRAREESYVVEVGTMEQAGRRLYTEAIRRGIDPADDLVICLGDGAVSNWDQFELHFPRRVEILDWYHAVEHLWAAGNGVCGAGTVEATAWVTERKTELWEGRVGDLLAALRTMADTPGGSTAAAEIHYFETNAVRMRYAEYRRHGYPIGSGMVESACKRVIGARAKQAGMCWTKAGVQAVLTLRAGLLSQRWTDTWALTRPTRQAA